jgi:hypothetical protein
MSKIEVLKQQALQKGISEAKFNALLKEYEEKATELGFEGAERETYIYSQLRRQIKIILLRKPETIRGVVVYEDFTDMSRFDKNNNTWNRVMLLVTPEKKLITLREFTINSMKDAVRYFGKEIEIDAIKGRDESNYIIDEKFKPTVIRELTPEEFERYVAECSKIEKVMRLKDLMDDTVAQSLNRKVVAVKANALMVTIFTNGIGRVSIEDDTLDLSEEVVYIGPVDFTEEARDLIIVGRFILTNDGSRMIRGSALVPEKYRRPEIAQEVIE